MKRTRGARAPWPAEVVFWKGAGAAAGSAYLRADQLCEIVAPGLAAEGITTSVRTNVRGVRSALVVLHKTALTRRMGLALLMLKARGNVVACDFIDRPPDSRIARRVDVLVASSYEQHRHFETAFPGKPVVYVPHHADLRITPDAGASAPPRVGYFGDPANALHLEALTAEGLCETVSADRVEDAAWLSRLAEFPIHYAVREARADLRFKPFTKGAVAARAGALIVTDRNLESEQALGADYAFLTRSRTYEDVRATILAALGAFGGGDWARAQAAMARVDAAASPDAVRSAFAELLQLARRLRGQRRLRPGGARGESA